MKNFLTSLIFAAALALLGCRAAQVSEYKDPFPPEMVGTWVTYLGPEQKIELTFAPDGAIPRIEHYVFGPMSAEEGGIYKDGPDPGTYMVAVLGPLKSQYNKRKNELKVTMEIESYTMQFVEGALKGRIVDTFTGAPSADGQTWNAAWRSYGWLEGAAEPPIDEIDKNPVPLVFKKINSDAALEELSKQLQKKD